MRISDRLVEINDHLTPAERRVAECVIADPSGVAFGTVSSLAARSGTSGPTVMRLATKLGLAGFVDLQAAVQEELSQQLRPAVERIGASPAGDPVARALEHEVENVRGTLSAVDRAVFTSAVRLLADRRRSVHVVTGEATSGVAALFVDGLDQLRGGAERLGGSEVAVARQLAFIAPGDVVVAIELRRYERWVVQAVQAAVEQGAELIAITDSPLSPVARPAGVVFTVMAEGPGPFDSHVGTLALTNALVAAVAERVRARAAERLARVEDAVRDHLDG
ncbi:MAG TPA: MurR/RpiR family transcriptional regulator [Acidimicrobiales bacterium]|nr:MurR/RpiR family transcriptional regulator [Acidimicrobiales bacterium]